ncbi:MAG: PhoH family protein, partial [Bacillota bacterium]|nr:PhoH family protein [Bacillota bacterium]
IRIKTLGQRNYVHSIRKNDLVFGIGPAGTGKTYLAVVMAVNALKNGQVNKIILTRPAVEAGESLGFLPGDLKEKVDPYLRPLYDALHDILGAEHTQRLIERGTIEIAPLAYMRGRTLDDAFVILDEAQNTTHAQMKMFLTRLGFGSKMVITGDQTQVDLPRGVKSGLIVAEEVLKDINGIPFIFLEQSDVVRHPLVGRIIQAYEKSKEKAVQ